MSWRQSLGFTPHSCGTWRRYFLTDRIDGLLDAARSGRSHTIDDDRVAAVIERTLCTTPADATHWSIRSTVLGVEEQSRIQALD